MPHEESGAQAPPPRDELVSEGQDATQWTHSERTLGEAVAGPRPSMARRRRSGSSVNSSAKRHVPTMARRSQATSPNVIHFVRDGGGIPDSSAAAWHNQAALNASLHALGAGMTLHIPPGTFHVMGGVEGVGLRDVCLLYTSPSPRD